MRRGIAGFGIVVAVATTFVVATPAGAQTSCDAYLAPAREVRGRKVGPESCTMIETALTFQGRAYTRIDIGLNGTTDGWLTKTGDYKEYITNAPDLVFPQTADPGPVLFGVARYERDKGAAMVVIYPADRAAWNGKMWVTVHGRGRSFKEGQLKPWNRNLDPAKPTGDLNKYDRLMLAKGYALVKTHRTSSEGLGEIVTTLEDGTTVDYCAFNDNAHLVMDYATVAQKAVETRLGRRPARTYFYGHSAGARIGRGINYQPGLNVRADGRPFFDGILADDGAAGGWLPVLYKDGQDVLFATEASKAAFVPQLDISHQNYNNIWPSQKPAYMSSSYLENKRNNGRILRDKGLAPARERMYEVRSISHSGGEAYPDGRRGDVTILDLSKMMDRFIDILDAWVEKGTNPPPTRSDWAELGDANRDGTIENPALAFPEVACPLGVYAPVEMTSAETAFHAFTGQGLEPLDRKNQLIDMNRNGVWDFRETPTGAWRRLGLLAKGETLTRERYVACVERAAGLLRTEGFFSGATAQAYVEQAKTADLAPTPSTGR